MYIFLFLSAVFIGLIDFRVPFASYWDELALFLVIFFWVIKITNGRKRVPIHSLYSILWLVVLVVIGIIGNILHPGFQNSKVAILKDILAFVKLPIVLLLLPQILERKKYNIKIISSLAKGIVLMTFAIAIVGYVVDIGVYINDPSRPLKTFQFFYQHCTFFVFSYVIVLAVLMKESIDKNKFYIILNCFLLFMTQRTKAFVAVMLVMFIVIMGQNRMTLFFSIIKEKVKFNKKYILFGICIISGLCILIGKDRAAYYWQYGLAAARPALYIVGIQLMCKYFPIGTGFGTFASFISGEYYSNIYYEYGISTVIGLRPTSYSYIGDTFWPYIYGQFGIIGIISYVILLIRLVKMYLRSITQYDTLMAFFVIWLYALFASTAEAFFTNATGIQMAIALSLIIAQTDKA